MNKIPWLVPSAVEYLRLILARIQEEGRSPKVLETGAGGSTLFFAECGCEITSFESNLRWYRKVDKALEEYDRTFIDLRYEPGYPKKGLKNIGNDYDVILIDGRGRVKSFFDVLYCQRRGGWLIVDNMERKKYRNEMRNFINHIHEEWIHFCTKNKNGGDWITTFWKVRKEE